MKPSKLELIPFAQSSIQAYYKGDFKPMLDVISDDCLYIGAASDIYHGINEMLADVEAIADAPTFTMRNARFELIETGADDQAIVYGEYDLESDLGYDMILAVHQRITSHFTWNGSEWKACCIHSSSEWEEPQDGEIFPTIASKRTFRYLRKILRESTRGIENRKRVKFNCADGTVLINPDLLIYAESAGKHSVLHLVDRDIVVNHMISDVQATLPATFLRCHRYYLVNVGHIENIERYQIRLSDGKTIPIPERRYKEVRDLIFAAMESPGPRE